MSRRKSTGDQEFGSDSFLDIIANIVGILIILIVVAGLRVAQQPAIAESGESLAAAAALDGSLTGASSAAPAAASEIQPAPSTAGPPSAESVVTEAAEHELAPLNAPEPSVSPTV